VIASEMREAYNTNAPSGGLEAPCAPMGPLVARPGSSRTRGTVPAFYAKPKQPHKPVNLDARLSRFHTHDGISGIETTRPVQALPQGILRPRTYTGVSAQSDKLGQPRRGTALRPRRRD